MRRTTPGLVAALVLGTSLLAGCGTEASGTPGGSGAATGAAPSSSTGPDGLVDVPALDPSAAAVGTSVFHFLRADRTVVAVAPWSACLSNGCWDGAPGLGGPVPSVGSPDALWFAFSYPGWDFDHVSFHPVDGARECGARVVEVAAEKVGDRLFRVDPAGLAGRWRVDVFGYAGAGQHGDAVASVEWTTTVDGTMPAPRATGALFFVDDGDRVTYGGPTLTVRDLDRTPRTADGTWTVTDEAGASVTVPLSRGPRGCEPAGAVSLEGGALTAAQEAALAQGPLTYRVDLRLDRATYTGTATWEPHASGPGEEPLAFVFEPPLPAWTG